MSEGRKIPIGSLIRVFILPSSLLFISGCFCYRYHQKLGQQSLSSAIRPAPLYEDVLPKDHERNLELKKNIAYASISTIIITTGTLIFVVYMYVHKHAAELCT